MLTSSVRVVLLESAQNMFLSNISKHKHFQMTVADPSHSFTCLACKSPQLLQDLPSLQLHFATEHGVVNILSSPATQAVLPPATFFCHADSCIPDEFFASCLFCGASGLQEEEMKEHLGSRHGVFFQQDWKRHCSQHCRYTVLCTTNLCSLV